MLFLLWLGQIEQPRTRPSRFDIFVKELLRFLPSTCVMSTSTTPIYVPVGYRSITPSLTVKDASVALKFYEAAFGAVLGLRLTDPQTGGVAHAEFRIGDSTLMISDEYPSYQCWAPEVGKGGLFMIYVPDVDAAFQKALKVGAFEVQGPADQFYGDRTARVNDPFGYRWTLAQRVKDVSEAEMTRLMAEWQAA